MAGGKYDKLAGKTRPGTYINFESDRNDTVGNSGRGIVLLPLIGYDFGPAKMPITLTAAPRMLTVWSSAAASTTRPTIRFA